MQPLLRHRWDLTPKKAVELQRQFAGGIILEDRPFPIITVCGLDVSYQKRADDFFAAAVVLSYPAFEVIEIRTAVAKSPFPYVPGLLSFREIPVLALALAQLECRPSLLACDGQGLAHPRRFGLACHLGLLYDIPSIGLAKSRLVGQFDIPGAARGSWSWLIDKQERIGQVVRTRDGVAPLFVSPGHRLSFDKARELALALSPKWRLSEPTRLAHREVNRLRTMNNDR